MRAIFSLLFSVFTIAAIAQQTTATPANARIKSFDQRKTLEKNSIVNGIAFKSIGPTVMSGRVVDVDVSEEDPSHFYVGYASGGLWKTTNNGTTFTPLFDKEQVITIGDVAVNWKNNIIWVGTGEVNSSRSSYAGVGMYKSTDGGKTWQHLGLGESHHIGRIVLHPTDPNTAWVAVLGHLYSPNKERGVYKTTDGGKTWKQVLTINENTGASDLVIDPQDPKVLYAATWHRERRAWDFIESGEESGIYQSTDGGDTWKLLNKIGGAFPKGEGAGRIGLAIMRNNGKRVIYATIDNYFRREKEKPTEPDVLTKEQLRTINKEQFLALKKYQIKEYLASNGFPEDFTVDKAIEMVKSDKMKPQELVEYTEEPNALVFDTQVIGLEVYRSDDDGKTWNKTHKGFVDGVYSSYGYYFGQVRVSPVDPNKIYLLGVPVIRSDDGGKTFKSIDQDNVHSDHHALWINSKRAGHIILGNDGGINISYDDGETWNHCNNPPLAQFYYIAADMATPYNVYGGLQDNGVWMGPSTYTPSTSWQSTGQYPYKSIGGGDGMQVAIDTRDNTTVYAGSQFGFYFRLNTKTGERKFITPRHKVGEKPLRWNWMTPIHLSIHQPDIFYMASNKLHRSFNRGDVFEAISGDLTKGGKKGDVPYGTISTIHESPLKFGLLYVGTDDGLVHVTRDGGYAWKKISDALPQDLWVNRVQASKFVEGRVYVCLSGYRYDDFGSYLYASDNYGDTWNKIGLDLPLEPINVVKEDPTNEDILYVGTDHGLYVSLNRGQSFQLMNNGLPAVPVHDVVIHPREKDIIVGTHGRSLYIGRGKELQQLKPDLIAQTIKTFEPDAVRWSGRWGNPYADWAEEQKVDVQLPVYVNAAGKVKIDIRTEAGLVVRSLELDAVKGLNYFNYDLTMDAAKAGDLEKKLNEKRKEEDKPITVKAAKNGKIYLPRGNYKWLATKDGKESEAALSVK